jgi:stage V sporulation protein G
MEEPGERLQAFCSVTFDNAFVVRDLKVIDGATGPFVAMPSRKLSGHCCRCGSKNHLRAIFCNQCGARQQSQAADKDDEGRARLYADIAHPINAHCREMIQQRVVQAFEEEKARSKLPDYAPSYEEFEQESVGAMPQPVGGRAFPNNPTSASQMPTRQVQGPEKPRGPHDHSRLHTRGRRRTNGGFGAGIFE